MRLFPKLRPAVSVARTGNGNGMSMRPASGRQCSLMPVPALTSLHFSHRTSTRSGGFETPVSASARRGRLPLARRSVAEAADRRFWINLFPIIPFPPSSPQTPQTPTPTHPPPTPTTHPLYHTLVPPRLAVTLQRRQPSLPRSPPFQ